MSKYNQWYKAALTASGVEPTDLSIVSAFQCIGQQIYPMMSIQHQIAAYAYSLFNKTIDHVYHRLSDRAKGKIFNKL